MPYLEHWLLQFGGHQGEVTETWTCGIRMHKYDVAPGTDPDEEDYLDGPAVPALSTWFAAVDSKISAEAKLLWVKFNKINPAGHYDDPSTTHQRAVNIAGAYNAPANHHPLQCCAVLTFYTDAAQRGLASRGRIYSPRPVVSVNGPGDVAGADRVAMATSAALLLNTLDVGLGLGVFRPSIESRGGGNPPYPNPGQVNQIDRVGVDSCLDIQRRRAYSQSREVSTAVVAY